MNLEQVKKDLENGVLIHRGAWIEILDYALALASQRSAMARLVVERLAPKFAIDSNGLDAWVCQCCTAEAKGSADVRPALVHDRNCMYVTALWMQLASGTQTVAPTLNLAKEMLLAKDRWDSSSAEARFHKSIKFLTKREQGYVMEAFRTVVSNS